MPASPIIEIKNLSAGYDNRTVLHDVNLTIYERDFLGIIGPNGGGKTTLIKCILGLLKPTAGEILYHTDSPSPEVAGSQCLPLNTRLSMGYLPQYSSIDRKFPITVEEVILSGLSSQGAGVAAALGVGAGWAAGAVASAHRAPLPTFPGRPGVVS